MKQKELEIRKMLESVSVIPTLSIVIDRLSELLENPKTSAEEIGKAITTDQALAAKVLKLVNSAFYGFQEKISTITHAVVILGFSTVKNIVLTAAIFDVFSPQKNKFTEFDMKRFWLHSIGCGAASKALARRIGFKEHEECFIAGLIHDIGKIILCHNFPSEFEKAFNHASTNKCLFYESEKCTIGITHDQIGEIIGKRWNLPKNLRNAMRYHHEPDPDVLYYTMTGIVHTADILVRAMNIGNGGDNRIPLISEAVWNDLGFNKIDLESLLYSIEEEFEKASVFTQFT
jgi:HD-like signal output (HDOD) protein